MKVAGENIQKAPPSDGLLRLPHFRTIAFRTLWEELTGSKGLVCHAHHCW